MSIYFEPVADWCLVQREAAPEAKTINGIIVPSSSITAIPQATVLAVGEGVTDHINIKPGDKIVLGKYNGMDEKFGDLVLTTVRYDEIRLIIREHSLPETADERIQ